MFLFSRPLGVRGPTAGNLRPLPTPAVANKLLVEGAGSMSINAGSPGGGPGGGYPSGGTPPTGELVMVMVGGGHGCITHGQGHPQCQTLAGGLARYIGAPTLVANPKTEATIFQRG